MKYILGLVLLIASLSCGRSRESQSHAEQQSNMFEVERDLFFGSLHNTVEVREVLGSVQNDFEAPILHDPAMKVNYMGNDIQAAANLGIYLSDLNYCILFEKKAEAKTYFETSYELSEVIQIEKKVLNFLMKRYENNLTQNDSLKAVVTQLLDQATLNLKDTDRERLAGIIMAGYQIENLHLVLTIINSLPDSLTTEQQKTKEQLIHYVLAQRNQIEVIYNFIRIHADPLDPNKNPNYPFFDNALRELVVVYRSINENSSLTELSAKVDAIRNGIINI